MIQINLFIFMISLCFGLFMVYVTAPKPQVILKYPTLDNINDMTYIDDENKCYKYVARPIECDN